MSQRAHIQTILARTSQPRIEASPLLALAALDEEPHTSPYAVSPFSRFFARQDAGGTTVPPGAAHPLTAFVAGLAGRRKQRFFCCLVAMASDAPRSPSASVFIERHLSRIFPAHPRSLASVLTPRPAARRVSASALPPYGLRLSENLLAKNKNAKRFSEPTVKAPLGTWERGTSRRFAQECPEGNPGKYKQEK